LRYEAGIAAWADPLFLRLKISLNTKVQEKSCRMKLQEEQIRYIDLPDVLETFVDSVKSVAFDGDTARIELCVTRVDSLKPKDTPTARRYPVCRLAMTPESFLSLANQFQTIVKTLEENGVVQRIKQETKHYNS